MMSNETEKVVAILAEFSGTTELIHGAEKMRDAGYKRFDCHSPFPIHGMDEAMGLGRSPEVILPECSVSPVAPLAFGCNGTPALSIILWLSPVNHFSAVRLLCR